MLGKMLVSGTRPDIVTFNTLIHAYCQDGEVRKAIQLLNSMRSGECHPDLVSYTSVMYGICKWTGLDEATDFLQRMRCESVVPNIAIWDILVRSSSKDVCSTKFQLLDDILADMKGNLLPNSSACANLLQ